jgi:hypothetical protein
MVCCGLRSVFTYQTACLLLDSFSLMPCEHCHIHPLLIEGVLQWPDCDGCYMSALTHTVIRIICRLHMMCVWLTPLVCLVGVHFSPHICGGAHVVYEMEWVVEWPWLLHEVFLESVFIFMCIYVYTLRAYSVCNT